MLTVDDIIAEIEDQRLREYTEAAVSRLDPAFWHAAASATGKYHPAYDQGSGGLVCHTVMCAIYALSGIRRYGVPHLCDVLLCSALLHDAWKNGEPWGRYTTKDHGATAARHMVEDWLVGFEDVESQIAIAAYAVYHHMGVWSEPQGLDPFEFRPENDAQRDYAAAALILQEADYYSTRRFLGDPDLERLREELSS